MLIRAIVIALCIGLLAPIAQGASALKREVLYDVVLDFNKDGVPDRAVLILNGPGNSDTSDLESERYGLGDNEQVDLAIYLGAGNTPLDITKPPSFEKDNIVDQARQFTYALPLKTNAAGSLLVQYSSYWGSSHEADETLTLQMKNGTPTIIGYDAEWTLHDSGSGCSIDLLKGNATSETGDDTGETKKHLKVAAKPIALVDWKRPLWPKICNP